MPFAQNVRLSITNIYYNQHFIAPVGASVNWVRLMLYSIWKWRRQWVLNKIRLTQNLVILSKSSRWIFMSFTENVYQFITCIHCKRRFSVPVGLSIIQSVFLRSIWKRRAQYYSKALWWDLNAPKNVSFLKYKQSDFNAIYTRCASVHYQYTL